MNKDFVFNRDMENKSTVGKGGKMPRMNSPKQGKTLSNFDFATSDEDFYSPLRDSELEEKRYAIFCEKDPSDENAFSVFKISDEEKSDILFISSTYPILQRFVMILRSGQKIDQLGQELIRRTAQVLQSLIFFVVKTDNTDPIECEGISLVKRQKIMKDMRIIEYLTEILHLPFKNTWFNIKDLSNEDPELIKVKQRKYIFPYIFQKKKQEKHLLKINEYMNIF